MKDNLQELYDRIQTFEVECGTDKAGGDILSVLDILGDLVLELQRIEASNAKVFNELSTATTTDRL